MVKSKINLGKVHWNGILDVILLVLLSTHNFGVNLPTMNNGRKDGKNCQNVSHQEDKQQITNSYQTKSYFFFQEVNHA